MSDFIEELFAKNDVPAAARKPRKKREPKVDAAPKETKARAAKSKVEPAIVESVELTDALATPVAGVTVLGEAHGEGWALYHADAVHLAAQLPDNSVDFNLHSPPFAALYTYSDSANDMGNSVDDAQFMKQYGFLIREQLRVMRPGRLVAVHCKMLVSYQSSSGMSGLLDFPGEIIRAYERCMNSCDACGTFGHDHRGRCGDCGGTVTRHQSFQFASHITVWKCPVTERARTNAHGLLYKTLRGDGSFTRQGLAEYVLVFRKWPSNEAEQSIADRNPVRHWNPSPKPGEPIEEPAGDAFPLPQWQEWASPVWMDIDQTYVLNVEQSRDDRDEKHMCPLQLDLIERCIVLWTNPGDSVWSPFAGMGSEGVVALKLGRRFIGSELKESYFDTGAGNLGAAEPNAKGSQVSLFGDM